jgi:eukaryotic-like serine/threonine-protein kinase
VSVNGGIEPVWSRDGKRLFYRTARALMAVEREPGPRFSIRSRRTLFEGSFFTMPMAHPNYDVSPDGKRFIMLRTDDLAQIVVITNWMSALRRGPS